MVHFSGIWMGHSDKIRNILLLYVFRSASNTEASPSKLLSNDDEVLSPTLIMRDSSRSSISACSETTLRLLR